MTDKKHCDQSVSCKAANMLVLLGAVLFDISLAGLFFGMAQAWALFGIGAAALALGLSRQPQGYKKVFRRRLSIRIPEGGNA